MKKLASIISILLVFLMLMGCSRTGLDNPSSSDTTGVLDTTIDASTDTTGTEDDTTTSEEKAKISYIHLDARRFTVDSLVDASTNIFEGEITNIYFDILKFPYAEPAVKNGDTSNMLATVYEVEVETSYKGENVNKAYFCVWGGIQGYKESDQIAKMKEYDMYDGTIRIMDIFEHLKIGDKRMFCTIVEGGEYLQSVGIYQWIYDPSEPDQTNRHNSISYNDVKTYLTSMHED